MIKVALSAPVMGEGKMRGSMEDGEEETRGDKEGQAEEKDRRKRK